VRGRAVLETARPQHVAVERVAGRRVAAVEAGAEPLHTLLARPVRERFRIDALAGLLLDPIVADGRSGIEPFLEVAALQQVALGVGGVPPDPRETVGL
jgi:hypothetical protein